MTHGIETSAEFLTELKQLGVQIQNETELASRLSEVPHWKVAFMTLARHGERLGIRFQAAPTTVRGRIVALLRCSAFPAPFVAEFLA